MAIDLQIENISKSFGDLELFGNISFTVEERQRIGLIARNGKGKSTLLKIIAGEEPLDDGKITLRNGVRMGYLEQEPDFAPGLTVIEACLQRSGKADIISRYEKALETGADDLQHLMEEMDRLDAWDYENRLKQVLSKLKIKDYSQPVNELSGGQKKRVALAAVLIEQPDLMILDEPTNHLDIDMVEWLEDFLSRMTGSLLMVTHDRYFLDKIVNIVCEVENKTLVRYNAGYTKYLDLKAARLARMQKEYDRQMREIAELEDFIARNKVRASTTKRAQAR